MIVERYFNHNGAPKVESSSWRKSDESDKRSVKIKGDFYVLDSISGAAFDVEAVIAQAPKTSTEQPDGSVIEMPVFESDSAYWRPFSLPLLPGYSEIAKEEYKKMVEQAEAARTQAKSESAARSLEQAEALKKSKLEALSEMTAKGFSEATARLMLGI